VKKIFCFSFLHFFVDFFSIYTLFTYKNSIDNFYLWAVIYNCLAFFTQPIFGAILSRRKHCLEISLLACVILAFSSLIPIYYIAIPITALMNSLYHVAAGEEVLEHTKKSAPLGIYIAFGSLGVGLGVTFHNDAFFMSMLVLFLFVAALTYSIEDEAYKINFNDDYISKKVNFKLLVLPLIFIFISVMIRGFFGQYSSNVQFANYNFLIISVVVFVGKFIGGFIFDYLKAHVLFLLSLLITIIGIVFNGNEYLMLLAYLGPNLLMGFTLDGIRRTMPNYKAFGFGLVAASLMFGTMIGNYFIVYLGYSEFIKYIFLLVNIILVYLTYILLKKERRYL